MTYTQEITLDLNSSSMATIVSAKQGDVDSRILVVHFTENGEPYEIPNSCTDAAFRMHTPDGRSILNVAPINHSEHTVTVTFTYDCLYKNGRAYADIVMFHDSTVLSTTSFIIDIVPQPAFSSQEAIASDEFLYLKSFIDRGNAVIEQATRNSEAFANGTRDGVPVIPSDPAYKKNSKYYADSIKDMEVTVTPTEEINTVDVIKTFENDHVKLDFKMGKCEAAFVAFDIDYNDGNLYIFRPDYSSMEDPLIFEIDNKGNLVVNFE